MKKSRSRTPRICERNIIPCDLPLLHVVGKDRKFWQRAADASCG